MIAWHTHRQKYPSTGSLLAWRKARPCCALMDKYPRTFSQWKYRVRPCGPWRGRASLQQGQKITILNQYKRLNHQYLHHNEQPVANSLTSYHFLHHHSASGKKHIPVFEVDISTILQGRPLSMTNPFLRRAEHCIGKVSDAPESAVWNSCSSISAILSRFYSLFNAPATNKRKEDVTKQ